MPDRALRSILMPAVEALNPRRLMEAQQRVDGAIGPDSIVKRDAVDPALPWQRIDAEFPGVIVAGPGQRRFAMPQGARIRHVAITAATVPSGGAFVVSLTGGERSESFSLPVGQSTSASGVDITIVPGAFLALDILAVNGAETVTISIHYQGGQ